VNQFVGLLAFSLGLGLFVFPRGVAAGLADSLGRSAGHRVTVAVRGVGAVGMLLGVALILA
jgi:hypothetical protein